jgi:nitroreductase
MKDESQNADALLEVILSRRSTPALSLQEPGPTTAQIERAIDAALAAPDHGALRPVRFVLIRGAARAQLAQLFVNRMQLRDPATPSAKLQKAGRQPLTAPLVIAVGAKVIEGHKVPAIEQLLSAGASVMNLLNALHAQGYGAIWLTGGNAYDPEIATALGFADSERCLGFIYVGTIAGPELPPRRPERSSQWREWDPGASG